MSAELLRQLADRYTFDSTPQPHDRGAYHVPFDDLTAGTAVESRLRAAAIRGERTIVIGASGSGKSSVLSFVFGGAVEGLAPLVISVSAAPLDSVANPSYMAGHVIQVLVQTAQRAEELSPDQAREALELATQRRIVSRSEARSRGLDTPSWMLQAGMANEAITQTSGELATSLAAQNDAISQLMRTLQTTGLQPVIIFDDSDRWVGRDPAIATSFLREIPRWLSELPVSVVVAAHDSYLDLDGPDVLEFCDTQIAIPPLRSSASLRSVLDRRIGLNVAETAFELVGIDDVFADGGVETLFELYGSDHSIRRAVRLAHVALNEAADQEHDLITPEQLRSAANAG